MNIEPEIGIQIKEISVSSQTSERDSLDENAVATEDARQTPQGAKPFFGQTCTYTDSCNR